MVKRLPEHVLVPKIPVLYRIPVVSHRAPLYSFVLIAFLAALSSASPDRRDSARTDSPLRESSPGWTLDFEPAVWLTAPNGNVRMPGNASNGNGQSFTVNALNIDSTRLSPFGELQLRRGKWRIGLSGFSFGLDNQGVQVGVPGQIGQARFRPGDTLETSMDLLSFSADVGYEIYTREQGQLDSGAPKYRASVILLGGIRSIDTTFQSDVFRSGSNIASTRADAFHAHPYGGVRLEMELFEDFSIDLLSTVGGLYTGDTESWSSDILVGFQWNPTPHFGAQIGYRQLLMGIEENNAPNEFAWNGGMAGLYGGVVLRF